MKTLKKIAPVAALALLATPAFAHPGGDHTHGFTLGFLHPLAGLDHLLAMVAVGLFAARAMPGRIFLAPAAFVLAMIAGAGLGLAGVPLPMVESSIAASVLLLGLLVTFALRVPPLLGVALCALFALFHGHAHGTEAAGGVVGYLAGFVIATAGLHALGARLGLALVRFRLAVEAAGGAIAAAGLALLAG